MDVNDLQNTEKEEYDDDRIVEKPDYVEEDDEPETQPEVVEETEEADKTEEIAEEDLPLGLSPTFVRGTNRYQLTGAICGYAGALILHGLLGMVGVFPEESGTSSMIFTIVGLLAGFVIGSYLSKRKKAELEAALKAAKENN